MREVICYEGIETIPGRVLGKNVLTWEDDEITISDNFNFDVPPIGLVKDIQREEDGSITADVQLVEGIFPQGVYCYTVFLVDVKMHKWKDILWVTQGLIKGVAIIPHNFHPIKGAS